MKSKVLFLWILTCCNLSINAQESSYVLLNYGGQAPLILEKPIVVVIPSYNNSKWCDWNLSSVFQQKYDNYRVVYIDDCSNDNTYELVMEKIKQSGLASRIQVIRNAKNQGALANIYTACHAAHNNEIIVTLDGDDAFTHPEVFKIINDAYQDPNVWLTYGQYIEHPEGWLGICHAIPDHIISSNAYRSYPWVTSHVRTYYAWLFKRIKQEDLMCENLFYPTTADLAIMFPLLEMAGGRFKFIDQIMYIHNQASPLNDFKLKRTKQAYFEQVIRNAPRYQPLLPIVIPEKSHC